MTTQTLLVTLTATLAGAYLARQTWRAWTASGCGKSCGCAAVSGQVSTGLVTPADLTARVKGRTTSKG